MGTISRELAGLSLETYSIHCLQSAQKGRDKQIDPVLPGKGVAAVIGGGCLREWEPDGGYGDHVALLAPNQCFHLVAPPALVDSLIAEGAYVMTPGLAFRMEGIP